MIQTQKKYIDIIDNENCFDVTSCDTNTEKYIDIIDNENCFDVISCDTNTKNLFPQSIAML